MALITVSGVGPKSALEIISAGTESVRTAIASEDIVWLTSIKGIGQKTAKRLVLELKIRLSHQHKCRLVVKTIKTFAMKRLPP